MQSQSMFTTYLPKNCIVITTSDVDTDLTNFWKEVMRRYEDRRHNIDQPILAPEELFISPNNLLSALNQFPRMLVSAETIEEKAGALNLKTEQPRKLPVDPKRETICSCKNILMKQTILFYWLQKVQDAEKV